MRTRILLASILLVAFLSVCSISAVCAQAATTENAPAVEAKPEPEVQAPDQAAKPAQDAKPAEPAPAKEAKPAELAPAKPTALSAPDTAPVITATTEVKIEPAAVTELTPDTDVFRRSPKIDGVINDGEWDAYYSFSTGDLELTTYVNWDAGNLYFAAKANKPIDLLAYLDANCDGWYNGEDNFEFRTLRGAEGADSLVVNRYDSRHAKSPTAAPVAPEEAALVEMKSGVMDGKTSIELRVPTSLIRSFKAVDGRRIGLLLTARTGSWIGSGSPGDTKELTLISKKMASLDPIKLGFDIRDVKIALGDELVAKLHITNTGPDRLDVRSYVIAGEGKAGDYLSSQMIRLDGLPAKKHISREIRSIIPQDMPLGSWALGAEVMTADSKLGGALLSFEVVEPFEVAIKLPIEPVKPTVKDVSVGVVVSNNKRSRVRGEVVLTMPEGWEVWKDENKRAFVAPSKGFGKVTFKVKPPLGIVGQVPVKMDITIGDKSLETSGNFTMASQ